jgi:hypothetical protein
VSSVNIQHQVRSKNPSFPRRRESSALIFLGSRFRGNDESRVFQGALRSFIPKAEQGWHHSDHRHLSHQSTSEISGISGVLEQSSQIIKEFED